MSDLVTRLRRNTVADCMAAAPEAADRITTLENTLRQAREALKNCRPPYAENPAPYNETLAAIDAVLSGAPPSELSDERIFAMIKADFGLPDVGMQKKLYAFARAVLKEGK